VRYGIASFEFFSGDGFNYGEYPFDPTRKALFHESVARADFVISHYLDEFPAYQALTQKAFYVPYGFHPKVEEIDHKKDKFFDVYFFGSLNPERARIIHELRSAGLAVAVHENRGNVTTRNSYIGASRVCLNLVQGGPYSHVSVQRVLYLANNRVSCVSNRNRDRDGYLQFTASFDTPALVDGCKGLIASGTDKRLGEEAYARFSSHLMRREFENLFDIVYTGN
jgi:hypothetical protein